MYPHFGASMKRKLIDVRDTVEGNLTNRLLDLEHFYEEYCKPTYGIRKTVNVSQRESDKIWLMMKKGTVYRYEMLNSLNKMLEMFEKYEKARKEETRDRYFSEFIKTVNQKLPEIENRIDTMMREINKAVSIGKKNSVLKMPRIRTAFSNDWRDIFSDFFEKSA